MKLSSSLYSLIAVGSANQARWSGKSYRDNGVLKFTIESETTGQALKRIEDDEDFMLEWLAPHEGPNYQTGTEIIIMTEPEDFKYVKKTLAKTGANINDTNNLDEMIAAQFTNQKKERSSFAYDEYHNLDEINAHLQSIVDPSNGVTLKTIGQSHEGRDIYRLDIGDTSLPTMVVDCGIHAREWASPAFCLYMINELINGDYTDWTEKMHWVIYPMLNPDGYEFTWNGDRMWRKNRNPNNGSTCKGVDLNRNYDAEWMHAGSSSSKCSSVYAGTSAFSEPESQAHRDDMINITNKKAYLTYHAYSEFIIYPYSSSYAAEAHNKATLDQLAGQMVQGIKGVHGKTYEYGEGAIAFYPASGGSDDWAHMNGYDLSFTIELRDTGTYGFLLPENQIIPNSEENMEGIRAVVDQITLGISYDCQDCSDDATCVFNDAASATSCVCNEGFQGNGQSCVDSSVPDKILDPTLDRITDGPGCVWPSNTLTNQVSALFTAKVGETYEVGKQVNRLCATHCGTPTETDNKCRNFNAQKGNENFECVQQSKGGKIYHFWNQIKENNRVSDAFFRAFHTIHRPIAKRRLCSPIRIVTDPFQDCGPLPEIRPEYSHTTFYNHTLTPKIGISCAKNTNRIGSNSIFASNIECKTKRRGFKWVHTKANGKLVHLKHNNGLLNRKYHCS